MPDSITMNIAGAAVTLPAATLTKLWLDHVRQAASAAASESSSTAPRIGARWAGAGGLYAGIVRGVDGGPDCHVILHEDQREGVNWTDAKAWAASLDGDGHRDFALPTRSEQALLYANLKDSFVQEWHWSCEAYRGDAGSAWYQFFDDGTQDYRHIDNELRARAVRRIPIQ